VVGTRIIYIVSAGICVFNQPFAAVRGPFVVLTILVLTFAVIPCKRTSDEDGDEDKQLDEAHGRR